MIKNENIEECRTHIYFSWKKSISCTLIVPTGMDSFPNERTVIHFGELIGCAPLLRRLSLFLDSFEYWQSNLKFGLTTPILLLTKYECRSSLFQLWKIEGRYDQQPREWILFVHMKLRMNQTFLQHELMKRCGCSSDVRSWIWIQPLKFSWFYFPNEREDTKHKYQCWFLSIVIQKMKHHSIISSPSNPHKSHMFC